jgi:hypothetical protein
MRKRVVTGDSPECPASHGFGENSMRWYVQANVDVFGVVASVMTLSETVDNACGEEQAWLWWTDGVSDWCEEHSSLSAAFARLGVLVALGEDGWVDAFRLADPHYFGLAWKTWACHM